MNSLELARDFHVIYERLAPSFGYETREDTKEFDPTSENGRLMIATCGVILEKIHFYEDTKSYIDTLFSLTSDNMSSVEEMEVRIKRLESIGLFL